MRRRLRARLAAWAVGRDDDTTATTTVAGGSALRRLWSRLAPYVGSNASVVAVLAVVSLLGGFTEAAVIFLVVRTAASLAGEDDAFDLSIGPLNEDLSTGAGLAIAGVAVAVVLALSAIASVLTAQLTGASLNRARRRTMRAFLGAGWETQSRETAGRLQELLSNNVQKVSQGVLAVTSGLNSFLSFVALMVSAIVIDPLASTVIFAAVLAIGALLIPIMRLTRRRARAGMERQRAYAMRVSEVVGVAREIDVFGVWDEVAETMGRHADAVARSGFVSRFLQRFSSALYQSAVLALLVAGMAIIDATTTRDIANLGSVVVLLVRALTYSQQLSSSLQAANEIAPFIEELEQREAHYRSQAQPDGDRRLERVDAIRFDGVSYAYEPGRPVLDSVSFAVDAGEVVGIVGPSGSGKSTLIQVLLRLRAPSSGSYLVNDAPAAEYDRRSWSRSFAFVPQDNSVVRGTVAENIRFFRDGVDDASVQRAATIAHLRDEVLALPNGFDTPIGPGVLELSGGQRQRLGLARALCVRPAVLVLDEPTSALDMRSESLIQQSLGTLKGEHTVFVIAHRLSTLTICDRIMVLEAGRVTAIGTYAELLGTSSFFKEAVALSRLPA